MDIDEMLPTMFILLGLIAGIGYFAGKASVKCPVWQKIEAPCEGCVPHYRDGKFIWVPPEVAEKVRVIDYTKEFPYEEGGR